ncbi:23S rRNA (uracil(1939)-C(5))-methyltransferase RlmD [Soehngenia longivitae]|uniref:23S rRNA (Uracil(1939)-C(5))-methyltransferase RlmD n=1 Tax=Soehngenia longivitae TaxID=2562294 RepID=A0A4Z0D690_9FIRM|nr:23S rRNA (uracil(1939)-C(5))-methyltransferase RlmD [Soehngenia longivitae]TFZ40413.1 23S rRNA (uracil(1939)-C(5))-methyltransferase RlmD [Soehngenia longivitae]
MELGEKYNGEVIDFNSEGLGVVKIDNQVIFVDNCVIGDTVEFEVIEKRKNYYIGEMTNIINYSKLREKYAFDTSKLGGGVPLINLKYEEQLKWKEKKIRSDLYKTLKIEYDIEPILGMTHPFRYRNNTQIPVGIKNGEKTIGYYKRKSNEIVPIEEDILQKEIGDKIIKSIKEWMNKYNVEAFDRTNNKGVLRHIGIRTNQDSLAMVILVTHTRELPYKNELVHKLVSETGSVVSIYQNINTDDKVKYGKEFIHIFGKEYLTDFIGDVKFNISPESFFQTNSYQTEKLYDIVKKYLAPKKSDVVFDLYSGIGSIALFIANDVDKVIGIEYTKSAVKDAKRNAVENNIGNAYFYQGKVEDLLPQLQKKEGKPNKIILDPPRAGADKKTLFEIIKLNPETIVYVSCDSATLARDLKILLENGFEVKKIKPVDMFPHTTEIECVVLIQKGTKKCSLEGLI